MNPKILLVNDLHISKDNISEYQKNWDEVLQVCKDRGVNTIIIGGDIFTSSTVQSLAPCLTVKRCFKQAVDQKIIIYVAAGNHDKQDRDSEESWIDLYADSVNVIPDFDIFYFGDYALAVFAYFPETKEKFKQMIEQCKKELDVELSNCFAYVHAGIHGALGDFDVPSEAPQEYFDGFKAVFASHYHNRTHINNSEIYYIGSSRAHNFGEDEEKGYTLLYPDGTWEFVKNQVNTRYTTEELSFADVADWQNTHSEEYKVRLIINCTSSEAETIDKQSLFQKGASKIEFKTEKLQATIVAAADIEDKFNNTDLQHEYQDWCNDKSIDCAMGIEYLQRIK